MANPTSIEGVIEIMEYLHKFIPKDPSGKPMPISMHSGDELSCERMKHSKRARIRAREEVDRLVGIIKTPQEFHKEGLLLQLSVSLTLY